MRQRQQGANHNATLLWVADQLPLFSSVYIYKSVTPWSIVQRPFCTTSPPAPCTHNCTSTLYNQTHAARQQSTMTMSAYIALLLPALAILSPAAAQTWTSCNPLNQTNCPADQALGISNATFDFVHNTARSDVWNTTAGNVVYGSDGAEFTIEKEGDAPTIQSKFYILFGEVEVWMKAAPGQGVVSSTQS